MNKELLILALDNYRVEANEEIKRLRAENDVLRKRLMHYRLLGQVIKPL